MRFSSQIDSKPDTDMGAIKRTVGTIVKVTQREEMEERKLPLSIALPFIAGLSIILWIMIAWLVGLFIFF
jgi:hypothetical protein